tara:strand:+ start:457 stop:684 length:228 start_codon:yes stop_codon:yes gene_type:complete
MSRLNSREIESFKSSCYNGAKVEWIYQDRSGSGKVSGSGFMDGVKVSGVLSHVISDYGLSNGMYSSLLVDGKRII